MKKESTNIQDIITLSKINAESVIKPMEKLVHIYKIFISVLVLFNLCLSGIFCFYIYNTNNTYKTTTKSLIYSINKLGKNLNVQRSDVRMDKETADELGIDK